MMADFLAFLPEATLLAGALALFVVVALGGSGETTWRAAVAVGVLGVVASGFGLTQAGEPFFPGVYRVDAFSQALKLGLTVGFLLVVLVGRALEGVRREVRAEVPLFLAIGTAGMMLLVSATEILTLYVALEVSALSLYVVAALHTEQRLGSEGAAKYVLFGAVSSAITLYGLSLVYGATGTTYLAEITALSLLDGVSPMLAVGVLLALSGLLFKLAVFPFHGWAADVYQSAPTVVVTFIATASKVAAVGIIARVVMLVRHDPGAMTTVLLVLSIASMTVGNLAALVQRDLKRLLAWSTVAHAGYLLIGLVTFSQGGVAASVFYGLVYLLMAFAVFLVVGAVARAGESPQIGAVAGLYRRSPLLGLLLLVGLFGLAGIPPTPGFAGKWFLFASAMQDGHFWLVLIAAVNATVSLYYYLVVVKEAFMAPGDDLPAVTLGAPVRVALIGTLAALTLLGVMPRPLWALAERAAVALIGG